MIAPCLVLLILAHCQWGSQPDSHLHKLSEMKHFSGQQEHLYMPLDPSINPREDVGQTDGKTQIIV